MRPYEFIPGVPAGGHVSRGFWHPGRIDGCLKCPTERTEPMRARPFRTTTPGVLLGYAELAELTGLSRSTLRNYKAKGYLPTPDDNSVADRPRWTAATIQEWIKHRPGQGARTDRKETPTQ